MAHEHYGGSINWDYFSAFESAFANKSLNMESALEDLQLATSEKVQYIIDNFMEICKVCLEPCKNMTKLDGSDTQIIKKINYLFYDEVLYLGNKMFLFIFYYLIFLGFFRAIRPKYIQPHLLSLFAQCESI